MFNDSLASIAPRSCALLLVLLASAASAQVYRIVGPDGRVTFSDRPAISAAQPQTETASTSQPASGTSSSVAAQLPYELRQIASRYPVTLYSGKDCQPCDEARMHLQNRGIPFSERTIETQNDVAALNKLSGQDNLPFATIGNQHLKGFNADNWDHNLTAAGYPKQPQLPKSYQAPAPKPLTMPPPKSAEQTKAAAQPEKPAQPTMPTPGSPTPNNPAGLRF